MDFFTTRITPEAVRLAVATLESGFVSEGVRVQEFEKALSADLGLRGPVAVNSGTSALHLGLVAAGVRAGDEVIMPPQTFIATGFAAVMCGARVVFADIQPTTGNICPEDVRRKVSARTRALVPVHWAGYPCDMDELNSIAAEHNLALVEDAAHALGAVYRGRPVGSLSRFTAFSFQAIKHLTTGDGGALCCLNPDDEQEARRLRWFGIDRDRDRPSLLGERQYNAKRLGFKYHMNDLAAAVGLGNLAGFQNLLNRHREIAARYRVGLRAVDGVQLLDAAEDRESAAWIFTMLVDRRDVFVRALKSRGVPVSVVHQRIDRNALFGGVRHDLEQQAIFDARQVSLPIHWALSDDEVCKIIEAVRFGW